MKSVLQTPEEVSELIKKGKVLVLAGEESLLERLPKGNWLGGTIPYFMDEKGGKFCTESILVQDFTNKITKHKISLIDERNFSAVTGESYNNGITFSIVPAFSRIHTYFAKQVVYLEKLYLNPLIGWVAGMQLEKAATITPKVFNGSTLEKSDQKMALMHMQLPEDMIARLEIINIFEPGEEDLIEFDTASFELENCHINGKSKNFAEYLLEKNHDIRFPLMANYNGAMINVSFREIDKEQKKVRLYAPVFKENKYRLAKPFTNYVELFNQNLRYIEKENVAFSCNCILNYLYAELEGKKLHNFTGPFTFGEIGYQLLNQTLTYLVIDGK